MGFSIDGGPVDDTRVIGIFTDSGDGGSVTFGAVYFVPGFMIGQHTATAKYYADPTDWAQGSCAFKDPSLWVIGY
jgi:hypothetical protein